MTAYQTTLLALHVLSAIVGLGPSYAFAILGPLAGKRRGTDAIALMDGMIAIERRLVIPGAITQVVTGVLLIFARNWDEGFFGHTWLWVAILLYVIDSGLSTGVSSPALHRLSDIAKAQTGPPSAEVQAEMGALAQRAKVIGTYLGISTIVIAILMVWKPGN